MKKNPILSLLLAGLLALALTACGGAPASDAPAAGELTTMGDAPAAGELTTMGDALAVESPYTYATWDDDHYVYVFDNNGTPTRVVADLTEELSQQIDDALFSDGGGENKVTELLSPLALTSVEDLSGGIPDQAALDELVGKTGQELLDDGYEIWGSSIDDSGVSYTLDKGLYEIEITTDGDPDQVDAEDPDAAMPGLTVTGAAYKGISSNATDLSITP